MIAPTLETEHYFLRSITMADAPALFTYAGNKQVTTFTQWPTHSSLSETRHFIKQHHHKPHSLLWGIISKENNAFLGECGIRLNNSIGEIHCTLSPEHWGKGVAYQTLQAIIQYNFTQLGIRTIEASIITENNRSIRLAQKLGMHHTVTLEHYWLIGTALHNVDVYTLTM